MACDSVDNFPFMSPSRTFQWGSGFLAAFDSPMMREAFFLSGLDDATGSTPSSPPRLFFYVLPIAVTGGLFSPVKVRHAVRTKTPPAA